MSQRCCRTFLNSLSRPFRFANTPCTASFCESQRDALPAPTLLNKTEGIVSELIKSFQYFNSSIDDISNYKIALLVHAAPPLPPSASGPLPGCRRTVNISNFREFVNQSVQIKKFKRYWQVHRWWCVWRHKSFRLFLI